jgi:biopolymer transport protein ExbD
METIKKVRSKKLSPRVDLTAMVSVSFLLIIFFMVTTELSKPKIFELSLPDICGNTIRCGPPMGCGGENRIVTILLGSNNRIVTYSGILEQPIDAPKDFKFGKEGIRKELFRKNKVALEYSATMGKLGRGITVIIKPSKNSNYGNLVDILDEMKITDISTYTIVNYFTPDESKLLASK